MTKVFTQEEMVLLEKCREMLKHTRLNLKGKDSDLILTLARLEVGAYNLQIKNSNNNSQNKEIKTTPKFIERILENKTYSLKPTDNGVGVLTKIEQEEELISGFIDGCLKNCSEKTIDEKIKYMLDNFIKLIKAQSDFDKVIKKTNGGILKASKKTML